MAIDKTRVVNVFCESHVYLLVQLKAGPGSRSGKGYNLQKVKNLNSRILSPLRPFKGVSTKYLDNYLIWNAFVVHHPDVNRIDLKVILQALMVTIGK